jgi:CSLREA domain-containing protein
MWRSRAGLLLALLALVLGVWPAGASAASIAVTATNDAVAADGRCSLREAITSANQDTAPFSGAGECADGSGADTISVPAGTFPLSIGGSGENANATGDLDVLGPVTISGAGASATTIDADQLDRVFDIGAGVPATIEKLTVSGGLTPNGSNGGDATGGSGSPGGSAMGGNGDPGEPGGGIRSAGTLVVEDCVVTGNTTGHGGTGGAAFGGFGDTLSAGADGGFARGGDGGDGGQGGGIYAAGDLTLLRSAVTANTTGAGGPGSAGTGGQGGGATATTGGAGGIGFGGVGGDGGDGGGVASENGTLTVEQSTISANMTGPGAKGGNGQGGDGGVSSGNPGTGGAGGLGSAGNGGAGGSGGGIRSAGDLVVSDSLIAGNTTGGGGNGGNGKGGAGGAAVVNGTGGTGGNGFGGGGAFGGFAGGLMVVAATLTNVTISANTLGAGGNGGNGTGGKGGNVAAGTNGTGGAGTAGNAADGGSGGGARIAAASTLAHLTIDSNTTGSGGSAGGATAGAAGSGGAGGSSGATQAGVNGGPGGGGALALAATATATNTIVAGNSTPSCDNPVTDGGHDIAFPDASCPGTQADPLLQPLADNGGATLTRALAASSPAIDAVPSSGAGCAATDQRGVSRPSGGACDAGAFERAAPGVTTSDATGVSTSAATLPGAVAPNATTASYHFEFGTSTDYGTSTAETSLGSGVAPVAVTAAVSGLSPGTSYHFRLVATNTFGSAASADRTFTTAPAAGAPGPAPGTVPADTVAPRFLSASLKPKVFAVDRRGRTEKPVASRRRARRGTVLRFSLSEAARVVFTIQRVLPGRRVGRACRRPTRANRNRKPCKRYVKPLRFGVAATAGANRKKFSGRVGRRALRPGNYRATLIATDAAKNRSTPKRLAFKIVRR